MPFSIAPPVQPTLATIALFLCHFLHAILYRISIAFSKNPLYPCSTSQLSRLPALAMFAARPAPTGDLETAIRLHDFNQTSTLLASHPFTNDHLSAALRTYIHYICPYKIGDYPFQELPGSSRAKQVPDTRIPPLLLSYAQPVNLPNVGSLPGVHAIVTPAILRAATISCRCTPQEHNLHLLQEFINHGIDLATPVSLGSFATGTILSLSIEQCKPHHVQWLLERLSSTTTSSPKPSNLPPPQPAHPAQAIRLLPDPTSPFPSSSFDSTERITNHISPLDLEMAASLSSSLILSTLLHAGCPPHSSALYKCMPVTSTGVDGLTLLLRWGANVNGQMTGWNTPLHAAVKSSQSGGEEYTVPGVIEGMRMGKARKLAMVKLLVRCGADVGMKDYHGLTAGDWAAKLGEEGCVEVLREEQRKRRSGEAGKDKEGMDSSSGSKGRRMVSKFRSFLNS